MTKRTPRKPVYRVNQIVEVVEPLVVRRVGYPLSLADGYDLIAKELAAELKAVNDALCRVARKARGESEQRVCGFEADAFILDEGGQPVRADPTVWTLAKRYLPMVGYGGRERSLHIETVELLRGQLVRVVGKRCVKTGTYRAPSGGMVGWETPEWESEPGGLDSERTHVLLEVEPVTNDPFCLNRVLWSGTVAREGELTVEIEARCVRVEQVES